ncbi:RNA-binding protein [Pseudaminobacter sp. 19-2017]|uniref:RNA-binding protein n=1 Tax=Pseudaminobacter soli (ex Zhang et al. 2022) TaxID=2831468 RepID=A0A942E5W9_9HYPH|nr:RNA-binding protein [Pseudaminobacter soli]MBS3651120.1 RNA-binding protein [Pseudaminobacter soli]
MNDRTCIVTRERREPDDLIRFVVAPDGTVVPDLKRKLPGRGCWVTAERLHVSRAVAKNLFARAFKRQVTVSPDLPELIDQVMTQSALGAVGLARKAGAVALGAAKVENAVRTGEALLVLHATDASPDGVRKITQARRATAHLGGPKIRAYKLFSEADLSLALGGTNVIHAAVLAKEAGRAAQRRLTALDRYRGGSPDDEAMFAAIAGDEAAAEDME